jgi:hypothetical protein
MSVVGVFPDLMDSAAFTDWMYALSLAYACAYTVLGGYLTAKLSVTNPFRQVYILALVGLAELGGFLLGILPGIWLSIILQFVFFILVLEHKNHKESISTSVFLVKDNFWKIFCYVIVLAIIGFLIGTIPFFGFMFGLLYGFFVRTFIFELYKTLTHNKITNPDVHHTNKNIINIVYLFASFAVLVLVVLLTALIVFVGLLNTNSNIANNYDNRFETIIDQPYK